MKDPSGLFNSSLDGKVRRAIDIKEGEQIDEAALKDLVLQAVALNRQVSAYSRGDVVPPLAQANGGPSTTSRRL